MKTSFHIGGFWFHVQWDNKGKTGKDQHGRLWYDHKNPYTDNRITETLCQITHDLVLTMAKSKTR